MYKQYISILHKDDTSDYGVYFPDFLGCITAADTLDKAKDRAKEALQFHIDGMLEDGAPIPEPSSLEAVMEDHDHSSGTAFLTNLILPDS